MDYEWIGPHGGMVPIRAAQSVSHSAEAPMRYYDTVTGGRRAQRLSARPLREWSFTHTAVSIGEADRLRALRDGIYGKGPFSLVSTEAQISNVLTPEQASMTTPMSALIQPDGPVRIGDNYFPASAIAEIPTGWQPLADNVPVIPGVPVTVSIWAMGEGSRAPILNVVWRSGTELDSESQTVTGNNSGLWQRLVWHGTPPPGVDSIRFGVRTGTKYIAAPQATWTRQAVQWAAGHGADHVNIDKVNVTPLQLGALGEQVADLNWTALEVS